MNVPVNLPLSCATKGTKDYIVAFGHPKLIKDRNRNDKEKRENKAIRKPVLSQLPRNVRSISSFRNPKSNGNVNIISLPGNAAGTSSHNSTVKSRTGSLGGEEKPKPSQIPRRKSAKELPIKESTMRTKNKNIPNRPKPIMTPRNNVQRVQFLNVNPDFCPAPTKSVLETSARPIPTLGYVYRQDISNDILTDWYLESVNEYNMNIPQDSTEPNAILNTAVRIENGCNTKFNEDNSVNTTYASSSNNAGPDQDYDSKQSQSTLEHVDENSASTDDTICSRLQGSQDTNSVKSSMTSYLTEMWREPYINDKNKTNRRKYPARQPYQKLKNHIWSGRNCKYGWSRVRKRTADRWAYWSRSMYGIRKLRMNDLKKSLIWDNANVQTAILVYRETGTDAVAKEQKSAEITTSLKLNGWTSFCENGSSTTSARNTKSPIRHVNIGPSMFPFLYYPSNDIKYAYPVNTESDTITKSTDQGFYYAVDRGTETIPPLSKSQRSVPVMTSKRLIQELTHKETQVSPEPSIRKLSTAALAQRYEDAKSSVFTETSVPHRIFDNTRLVTSKGKILSCTGAKVTSVSSPPIQTASKLSTMSKDNVVNTVIHPECTSVSINTDVELKSTGTGVSFDNNRFENRNKSTNDCDVQCSESPYRRRNETWDISRYVARIGRNRLMSVSMLSDSATEMATQAQPVFQCAETNTPFKQKMSASVFTSRYAIGEPLRSSVKVQPKDTEHILTCHCANTACDTQPIDAKERRSQTFAPVHNDVACKTNSEVKSVSRLTTRNETARETARPNFVISSNLNATKWLKGCTKESDKETQSIISISETMVTELDRASLVTATSKDGQSIGEIKKLSEDVINHHPAVGCVTTMGCHPSSSQLGVTRMVPIKDENSERDKHTSSNQPSDNNDVIVNKMMSGFSGTGFDVTRSKKQAASVLTSRHILPNPPRCEDSSKDCIFLYGRPRCIVHSFRADAVVQTELLLRNSEVPYKKHGSLSSRSVGQAVTPFKRRSSCCHPRSGVGEVLSPKVYKALYDTMKLIAKEGSESPTPKSSTTGKEASETIVPKSSKTEKRGSIIITADSSYTQNISKITGKMNNRSIQTVTEPVSVCPHCNARLSQTQYNLDRESIKSRSIQAAGESLLNCPQCSANIAVLSEDSHHESTEECIESYLVASCRYYSNLLTMKLGQVKDNFKKHVAPSIEGAMYQAAAIPNNIFRRTPSNNIMFTEACTMKPSGRRDETCEAKFYTATLNKHSLLYPALSFTDVRGHDKNDLKNVYYMLTAIEGRVRRLKSNLTS
ncbi:uncharacterized protein LOC123866640 isoform X3 [Maniola jurtina]|uniref:uncharacterized protein LOC123866640 isoform X3 n=1 Tax=Maniola jurtina TaxID=191418 RepID=UPI001E68D6EE|nr:uncharacterized protein LOC123866640 isoform X3 [Maniola jurtina]